MPNSQQMEPSQYAGWLILCAALRHSQVPDTRFIYLVSIGQVNASPSLTHTTPSNRVMKTSLISDVINIVISPSGFPEYVQAKQDHSVLKVMIKLVLLRGW